MNNIFCYEIKKNEGDYRRLIVSEGHCELFFGTSFVEEKGVTKCYADVSDYFAVGTYVEMPLRAALDIVIAVLRGILGAAYRYMLPWDYVISVKTVYADRTGEKARLIYMPAATGKSGSKIGSVSKAMRSFCNELSEQISAEEKEAFVEVSSVFEKDYLKPEECLRELYMIRRKIKTCLDL